jgi:hypothetical protein
MPQPSTAQRAVVYALHNQDYTRLYLLKSDMLRNRFSGGTRAQDEWSRAHTDEIVANILGNYLS